MISDTDRYRIEYQTWSGAHRGADVRRVRADRDGRARPARARVRTSPPSSRPRTPACTGRAGGRRRPGRPRRSTRRSSSARGRACARRAGAGRRPRRRSRAGATPRPRRGPLRPGAAPARAGRSCGRCGARTPSAARRGRAPRGSTRSACSTLPIWVSWSRTPDGAPPCSRPLQRADGPAHRACQVGAGRCHNAGGERRGVQAVLGAADEVGVERALAGRLGHLAGDRVEQTPGDAEPGRHRRGRRVVAGAEAREAADDRRRERDQLARLVRRRRPVEPAGGAPCGDAAAKRVERRGLGGRPRRAASTGSSSAAGGSDAGAAGHSPSSRSAVTLSKSRAPRGRRSRSRGRAASRPIRRPG